MQFLFPGVLWALSLLALPVIIHIFNFRKHTSIYFSNVAFLTGVQQARRSRSTLKDILILIARLLALTAVILVFARPFIPNNTAQKLSGGATISIYIDNSMSMELEGRNGILLEQAKLKALEIADAFPPSTQFRLITNNFDLKHANIVSQWQIKELIAGVMFSGVSRSVNDILQYNQLMNEQKNKGNNWLFLISDFQTTACLSEPIVVDSVQQYTLMPVSVQPTNNITIDTVWFSSPGTFLNKLEELNLQITNHSDQAYKGLPLNLSLNNTPKTLLNLDIEPQQTKTVTMPFIQTQSGLIFAKAEITDYPVTYDNAIYFNYEIKKQINLLEVYSNTPAVFLPAIFNNDSNFVFRAIPLSSLVPDQLNQFDLIILNELQTLSGGLSTALAQYIYNGGKVLIIPPANGNIDPSNQLLISCNGPVFTEFIQTKGQCINLNTAHALFNGVFAQQNFQEAKLPEYTGYYHLKLNNNTIVNSVLQTESGEPFFTIVGFGSGSISLLSVPMDPGITNLINHPLVLPLFYNTALQSQSVQRLYYTLEPGLMAMVKQPTNISASIILKSNDHDLELIPKKLINQTGINIYPDAEQLFQGHYSLYADKEPYTGLSLNINRHESVINYLSDDELLKLFKSAGATKATLFSSRQKISGAKIETMQRGKDLTALFIIVTIMALLTEIVLLKIRLSKASNQVPGKANSI